MDVDVIMNMLSNYIFPIAACVFLAIENRDQRKSHGEEMDKMTKALNDNTLAITRLVDHMEDAKYVSNITGRD